MLFLRVDMKQNKRLHTRTHNMMKYKKIEEKRKK